MSKLSTDAVEIFYSYAHEDEKLLNSLKKHLSVLRQEGRIKDWHDRQIIAGRDWAHEIDMHIDTAALILLLISPDFLASDYCYGIEMQRALERHKTGEAHVLPVILRPVEWSDAPFARLQVLPKDGRPITRWGNRDDAFVDVAAGVRKVIEQLVPQLIPARSLPVHKPYFVNLTSFQDRQVETALVNAFLRDPAGRLLVVNGFSGIGKTALIRRVCKELEEHGKLPDGGGPLAVDAIIYMNADTTVYDIFHDLCDRLPPDVAMLPRKLYSQKTTSLEVKMDQLLEGFSHGLTLLLFNDFETILDQSGKVKDPELLQVLRAIINFPQEHTLKVIVITALKVPELQASIATAGIGSITNLSLEGLSLADTETYVRLLDKSVQARLRLASSEEMQLLYQRTKGNPRALQAVHQVLSSNPHTTLLEALKNIRGETSSFVIEALVKEAFDGLDPVSKQLMQALAVYDGPVTASAIDYLLELYIPDIASEPLLDRLTTNFFVIKDGGVYTLHASDKVYAFHSLPIGKPGDRFITQHPPTLFALVYRAAMYFKRVMQNDDSAAHILTNTDTLLLDYEAYQLLIDQYQDIYPGIQNLSLRMVIDLDIGIALESSKAYQEALARYEAALTTARQVMNRDLETGFLINMAGVHTTLGNLREAAKALEHALVLAQASGKRNSEWAVRNNLGICYFELGETTHAIEQYQQVLVLAEEREDVYGMMLAYLHLGNCYTRQQDDREAEVVYEKALGLYQQEVYPEKGIQRQKLQQYRLIRGSTLHSLAEFLIDQGRYDQAIERASEAAGIDQQQVGSEIHSVLARAYLSKNQLTEAYEEAETALTYHHPTNRPYILLLLGIISLRKGEPKNASVSFQQAITLTQTIMSSEGETVQLYDVQSVAYAGLSLCNGESLLLKEARDAYNCARGINNEKGVCRRVKGLLDTLKAMQTSSEEIWREISQIWFA